MINFKIIAVDFDGTLCENKWPDIGVANTKLIKYLINEQKKGSKIILWTCKVGDKLDSAIEWCKKYDLYFDAVNENLKESVEEFGNESRKIFAHEYIDDRATNSGFCLPYMKKTMEYEKDAINAAKDLRYGKDVIESIKNAKSDSEIQRIMISARKKHFKMNEKF